jgi:hypothetical protein
MKALIAMTLILAFASCSNTMTKNRANVEADVRAEAQLSEDFGSAFEGDQGKRLEFLKGKISEKRKALDELSSETNDMQTAEILENEILLLEAERFNIQSSNDEDDEELEMQQ